LEADTESKLLDCLFNSRSVAVIGASEDEKKWGFSAQISPRRRLQGKVIPEPEQLEQHERHMSLSLTYF